MTLNDIFAVVVLYKRTLAQSVTLQTLNASAASMGEKLKILIYDNSPTALHLTECSSLKNLNIYYEHDSTNPGVSKAYNVGALHAQRNRCSHLLLTDQDTYFPLDSLEKYVNGVNESGEVKLFCPILQTQHGIVYSPAKYVFRRGKIWKDVAPGKYHLHNKTALNSGLLIGTDAFFEAGGYDERIKLYFSDFEFINRFRSRFEFMQVLDLVCLHSLSDIEVTDRTSALKRFRYYTEGSYRTAKTSLDFVYSFGTVFLRSLKLTIEFSSLQFLLIFIRQYVFASFPKHSS